MRAELADGRVLEFPDGTPPEVVQATVKKVISGEVGGPPSAGDQALGLAKAAGSGAAEGAIGSTVGAPGDLIDLARSVKEWGSEKLGITPSTGGIAKLLNANPANLVTPFLPRTKQLTKDLGVDYEPKTTAEKYVKSGSAGVAGGAMPLGDMSLLARLGIGGVSGVGGEAAAQGTGGNNPWARLGGSSAAGLLMAALAARRPGAANMVSSVFGRQPGESPFRESQGERAIREGATRAEEGGRTLGAPMTLSQGIEDPNLTSEIARTLSQQPEGRAINQVLEGQPAAVKEQVSRLAQSMTDLEPNSGATLAEVNRAGASGMRAAEQERTAATQPHYRAGEQDWVSGGHMQPLAMQVEGLLGEHNLHPTMNPSARPIRQLAERLAALGGRNEGMSATELDNIAKQMRDAAMREQNPSDRASQLATAGILSDAVAGASPNVRQGRSVHQFFTEGVVDPLARSGLPEIGNAQSMTSAVTAMNKGGPQDIRAIGSRMRASDPEAFPALVKHELTSLMNQVDASGRPSPSFIDNIVNNFYGAEGSQTRANYIAKMHEVAAARGVDPDQLIEGTNRLMESFRMAARDRPQPGFNSSAFLAEAGNKPISRALIRDIDTRRPMAWLGRIINSVGPGPGADYRTVAELLSSPQGARQLVNLANYSRGSPVIGRLTQQLLDVNAINQAAPGQ